MKKTILIVDDSDEIRDFLKKVLVTNNFKVVEAADGEQALEAVEKFLPDLVLLDFGLPKVTGETVCVKIKKDHPNIIVIALTEKTRSSDVVHGLQIGADDYISKPFVAEELIARIDTRFKTVINEPIQPHSKSQAPVDDSLVQEPELGKITLRESVVIVIIRLVFTEVLFGLSLLALSIVSSYINSFISFSYFSVFYIIVFSGVFLINIWVILLVAIKWSTEYSEVSKDGVIKHSGILHKKHQKYVCSFVEGVKVEQSFLGMLFNYGTIELYDPSLKEQVCISNVAKPKKYSEIIQKIVASEKKNTIPIIPQ